MATVSYITPIMNRTREDVEYAKSHQNDLVHKNIGAWNYTDVNRICNNLKYAAEYMYEQGFLLTPYSMQIKTDWTETDIITYEQLNTMIINNMNNLKTYSRSDIEWHDIALIVNMDYNLANWIEQNIHMLATQKPLPPETYKLTIKNGRGSGDYEANTIVNIQANAPEAGQVFYHWSGDHLENIGNPMSAITTYKMPHQDITLEANYTGLVPHSFTINTNTRHETISSMMGDIHSIKADPAPYGKVFHHWIVEPEKYSDNLYEPAATTHFTMPNENVTITAFYITKGLKYLEVRKGTGTGYYEYDSYVSISPTIPVNGTFTTWSGSTQYLTDAITSSHNAVKIPDVDHIIISANWSSPPTPLTTNVLLTLINGTISSTGASTGEFTEGDYVTINANSPASGWIFTGWYSGNTYISGSTSTSIRIGTTPVTYTATYRELAYYRLIVNTHSGTTSTIKEQEDFFIVNAYPAPAGYTLDKWTGDTHSYHYPFHIDYAQASTYMGDSDRTLTATYRPILPHTVTVRQRSGEVSYTQLEFSTINITADEAPSGQRFAGWSILGAGALSSSFSRRTTFTFGNGNATLIPRYITVWEVRVVNGYIKDRPGLLLDEGTSYELVCNRLETYERFDGWGKSGAGTIKNIASTSTIFTVGHGNATIVANIGQYPDKTLRVYLRNPETGTDNLISSRTCKYGSNIVLEAPIAPERTTFSSWLGDVDQLTPNALASTVAVAGINKNTSLIATYFFPKSPQYYTLSVYNGYPESGTYAAGTQIVIRANSPSQDWEFYKWYGDIQFLVNPDLSLSENVVTMPLKSITLYAKYKMVGELPLYRVSVIGGTVSGTYTDSRGYVHEESGVYIDIPAGTIVTLTAEDDLPDSVFDYWSGNFGPAGVTDILASNRVTTFTMVESDLNIMMNRRDRDKYKLYTTNAIGGGDYEPGTYTITGNLVDTDDIHYVFSHNWTCEDVDHNDCIDAIADPTALETTVTITDKSLWVTAIYTNHYKLTVIEGQDTGSGYYYEGETINTIKANTPEAGSQLRFDHWDDPMNIIQNIYDPTPTIIMKNSIATITAVFTSLDTKGNSIVVTGDDLHTGIITRERTSLVNGIFAVGTLVFDADGCIAVINEIDPDLDDNTDDYRVEKLFYGGIK